MRRAPLLPLAACTLLLLPFAARPLPAAGQSGAQSAGQSVYTPADHWSADALLRLDAFWESDAEVPWGFGTVPRGDVLAVFARLAGAEDGTDEGDAPDAADAPGGAAAQDADAPLPDALVHLARAYHDRFAEEVRSAGGADDPGSGRLRWAGGYVDVRAGRHSGAVSTGSGYFPPQGELSPPRPFGDDRSFLGAAGGSLALGPLGMSGEVRTGMDGRAEVGELYAVAGAGPVDVWGGRRAPALGGGTGGTIVLDGRVPLTGGGLALARPLALPSFLRYLGPIRFETHVARFDDSGDVGRPWFWTARGSFAPHPQITLAINRGAIFGGEGSPPMTVRHVLGTLAGTRGADPSGEFPRSAFANQIASGELRIRLPFESVPTTYYMEWGMEDSHAAWINVPGIVTGVRVASLPGAPGVSLGVERTYFAGSCCFNPPWYRHSHFSGGWANDGLALGHPLGGEGGEWLLHGGADLMEARLRSAWRLFHRERGEENLFVPDRLGTSVGGALEARYRVRPWADLVLDLHFERGTGGADWDEARAFLGVRGFF